MAKKPATNREPAAKPKSKASEATKAKAKEVFDGLFAPQRRKAEVAQIKPPADKRKGFLQLAGMVIDDDISTQQDLVTFLDEVSDGKARVYAQAIWGTMQNLTDGLPDVSDWNAVFGEIDSGTQTQENTDDEQASDTDSVDQAGIRPGELGGDRRPGSGDDAQVLGGEQAEDVQTPKKPQSPPEVRSDQGGQGDAATSPGPAADAADGRSGTSAEGLVSDGAGGTGERSGRGSVKPDESRNYRIDDPEALVGGGPKAKFAKNRAAIEAYQAITEENRHATAEERDAIASYIGWGSFGQELFNGTWERPNPKDGWAKEDQWLRDHLGKDEWESAQRSIINAHYTDPPTVQTMWDMILKMGFDGGRGLEHGLGIGNFFGLMPQSIAHKMDLTGIELDTLTGGMAKILYPEANIQIMGYEKSQTPDGFYDIVFGNWPFAAQSPADRRYNKLSPTLHDYYFLKALDQVRPGGLVVGITSSGTLDKSGTSSRLEMAKKADLVAAFRLPTGAFGKYAGTAVVTDIIVFKKRADKDGIQEIPAWVNAVKIKTPAGPEIRVNQYYVDNPGNVLGTLDYGHHTTQGRPGMIVNRPKDFESRLKALPEKVPAGTYQPRAKVDSRRYVTNNTADRNNSVTTGEDGKLYIVQGERMVRLEDVVQIAIKSKKKTAERFDQLKEMVGIRKALGQLIDAQREGAENEGDLRKNLKALYTAFTKKHGPVNESQALTYLKQVSDPSFAQIAALERNAETKKGSPPIWEPTAILDRSTVRAKPRGEKLSIQDALVFQRNEALTLDIDRIATLADSTEAEVIKRLTGINAIFKTPQDVWEPSDVYLSGNVRVKLREALAAKEQGIEGMDRNIEALEKVLPEATPYFQIEAKLGNNWTEAKYYKDFVAEMLSLDQATMDRVEITFGPQGWKVRFADRSINFKPEANSQWGVPDFPFHRLLQAAMNNVTITIRKRDSDGSQYVDETSTAKANEKAAIIREHFSEWAWKDAERRVAMEEAFNDVFNAVADPQFDGTFLTFEGMALQRGDSTFNLRKHQVDGIARGVILGRGIYAHEVGTGKTYTMGGIAVESRRYGIAKKPLIFAHNANSATVAREVNEMYPGAKVLYVDNFSGKNKEVALAQIQNDEWDAIVVPHSLVDRFALRPETYQALAAEEIAELEAAALDAAEEDGVALDPSMMADEKEMRKVRSPRAKELVKARNRIIERIQRMSQKSSEDAIIFEDAGIDMVIVDEAHEFKKPPIATKMRMRGLNTAASDRSINMMFMLNYINGINSGKGVHLFTGTPITNTLNEIYNMMRFVAGDVMKKDGVAHWDAWFNTFADQNTDVELTPSGEYEPVTRLSSFVNVPELRRMVGQFMDTVFADDMPEFNPRATASGKDMNATDLTDDERRELTHGRSETPQGRPYKIIRNVVAEMSPQQKTIQAKLKKLSQMFRDATRKVRRELMLSGHPSSPVLVETAAANAGLDARLLDMKAEDYEISKVNRAVANVMEHYQEHAKATQVIFMERGFSDSGTVSAGRTQAGEKLTQKVARFNLAKDIVAKLVSKGVPEEQIAIVDGGMSKLKRQQVADAMNRGDIRVVIGQTGTLGTGVNMQENLRAMHHLDAPWRPGDLEQRNGRGHRQGNKWNSVFEYRYITEGIDGRRWQVLVIKDKFIKAFLRNKGDDRIIEGEAASMDDDGGDLLATFSDAAGDPRILQIEKLKKDVEKLQRRERMHGEGIVETRGRIRSYNSDIANTEATLKANREDAAKYEAEKARAETFSITIGKSTYTEKEDTNQAFDAIVPTLPIRGHKDFALPWKSVGTFLGFELTGRNREYSTGDIKAEFRIEGKDRYEFKGSVASLEATLRNIAKNADALAERIEDRRKSVANLEESAKAPFAQAEQLDRKKKMVEQIETDLRINPIPAPGWLRQATPLGSSIHVDGQEAAVAGHLWNERGWYVLVEDSDDGTKPIPYLEAKDEQGVPIYDEREFEPPRVVEQGKPEAGATESTPEKREQAEPEAPLSPQPLAEIRGQTVLPVGTPRIRTPKLDRMRKILGQAEARLEVLEDETPPGTRAEHNERIQKLEARIATIREKIGLEENARIKKIGDTGILGAPKRITSEQDQAYMAAVKKGDRKAVQAMVADAAKAAGYNVGPVFHGTDAEFNVFTKDNPTYWGNEPGFFFTDEKAAKNYAEAASELHYQNSFDPKTGKRTRNPPRVIKAYLRLENPEAINVEGDPDEYIDANTIEGDAIVSGDTGTTYVVSKPDQIKSAGLVIRDPSGKIIPLSQRFNPDSDSILAAPRRVKGTDVEERIVSETVGSAEDPRSYRQKVGEAIANLNDRNRAEIKQGLLDNLHAIKLLEKESLGTVADASASAYKSAHLTRELASAVLHLVKHGQLEFRNGWFYPKEGTKGLFEILKPIIDAGKTQLWESYMAAYRGKRLIKEGRERNFADDPDLSKPGAMTAQQKIDAMVALEEKHPEFKKAREEYRQFSEALLDLALASGLIGKAQHKQWLEYGDYVPLNRIQELASGEKKTTGPNSKNPFHKLKGGEGKVDILENMYRNMETILDASFQNAAKVKLVSMAHDNTDVLHRVPYQHVPFKVEVSEIKKSLAREGFDTESIGEEDLNTIVNFWRMKAPKPKGLLDVMIDGKPAFFKIKDPLLARSVLAIGPQNYGVMLKLLSGFRTLLTRTITLMPEYMTANFIRDTAHSYVISEGKIHLGLSAAKGAAKAMSSDPSLLAIMAGGGGSGTYHRMGQGQVRRQFERMTAREKQTFFGTILDTPRKVFDVAERFGRAMENANRIAQYDSAIAEGTSEAEAVWRAKDLQNFTMYGDWQTITFLRQTVPFFNARLQGLYRLGRAFKYNKRRFLTHGGMMAGATLALMAKNWDDDRYWELEDWDRDTYYHIWLNDQHFRIPKPFEVGAIFSTIPERMFQATFKDGDMRLLGGRLLHMFWETFAMNPIPQAFLPVAEQLANKNTFTMRPIVGLGDSFKEPEEQFNAWTSATFREIAKAMPDWTHPWMRSPKRLEAFWSGYLATLGDYLIDASDLVVRNALDYPERPARVIQDAPVIGRFWRDDELRQTRYVQEYYDLMREVDDLQRRIRYLREEAKDPQAAARLAQEKSEQLAIAPQVKEINKRLQDVRKLERKVYFDPTGDPERKREKLTRLTEQKNQLAERGAELSPRKRKQKPLVQFWVD